MHILLAAATSFEIQPIIDFLATRTAGTGPPTPPAPLPLSAKTADPSSPNRVSTLITGVGGTAATWSLMRHIYTERPDLIIQAGIAGCLTGRKPGEVLVIGSEQFADLGVWEDRQFKTLFDLGLANGDMPPFLRGQLINPYHRLLSLSSLATVNGITVNEITTDPIRVRWYQQNTAAVVESMEGAALHYVGLREGIGFLQLRAVSNDIGVRDKTRWDLPTAIGNLNGQLIRLLRRLDQQDVTILEL